MMPLETAKVLLNATKNSTTNYMLIEALSVALICIDKEISRKEGKTE